jgi:hypothetical protein
MLVLWMSQRYKYLDLRLSQAIGHCVQEGNLEVLRLLLNNGVAPTTEEADDLLNLRLGKGYDGIARLLLGKGATITAEEGGSIAFSSTTWGHDGIPKLRLEQSVSLTAVLASRFLKDAAVRGQIGAARYMLEHGADVLDQTPYDRRLSTAVE